jgi:hypothetical protein
LEESWDDPGFQFGVFGLAEHSAAKAAVEATNSEPRIAAMNARQYVQDAFAGAGEGPSLSGVLDASRAASERREQATLLRDIFVNPFRPPAFNPSCLTPQIIALAQAAYDERVLPQGNLDDALLRVLGDALEEAGCDQADILEHLHGPGPHVRGCWAVDTVLGKK